MRNYGFIRFLILFTRDLLYLSNFLSDPFQYLLFLLLIMAVIGFGVIQTNHSPVFHYTGGLCNTLQQTQTIKFFKPIKPMWPYYIFTGNFMHYRSKHEKVFTSKNNGFFSNIYRKCYYKRINIMKYIFVKNLKV